jgi:ubiquinone/menaquinone biosynthesis C-methylase UbiE
MTGIKAHLGCWHRIIPGFVHVDLCDLPHIDYKSRIDQLPFFADNSIELIYCSHALEYFDLDETVRALAEWRRVLQPGGILRLAVPDFAALIRIYQNTGELANVIGPLFGKMTIPAFDGPLTLYSKMVWDQKSLARLFFEMGFIQPELWNWRTTEHYEIDDHSQAYFPHMEKETGLLVSLNMQAIKA